MRFSELFTRTSKTVSEETESINARLLTRAGFIYQEIAGVYTFLPLGLRVLRKIEEIVREEMDTVATEMLMPTLTSPERWRDTDRYESVDVLFKALGANEPSRLKNDAEYVVNPTHEDVVTPIARHFRTSYKDLPFQVYQIQTKFRNEPRAKSGLLRGREFRMKDMYSFHADEATLKEFYEQTKDLYARIYERLGLGEDTFLTLASGGDFTEDYSHEFQTLLPSGEDTIYLDREKNIAYNKEVTTPADAKKLGVNFAELEVVTASEVGNIFPLGTKYSKALGYEYVTADNQRQLVWMGSYGIGTSRLMGVIAEKFADEKGLVWPEQLAPFRYHLVVLGEDEAVRSAAESLYTELAGEVLMDDRSGVTAGEKFADAELIGCPIRLVVSGKNLASHEVEVSSRVGTFDDTRIALSHAKQALAKLNA